MQPPLVGVSGHFISRSSPPLAIQSPDSIVLGGLFEFHDVYVRFCATLR